jgi:hypothetical protein
MISWQPTPSHSRGCRTTPAPHHVQFDLLPAALPIGAAVHKVA